MIAWLKAQIAEVRRVYGWYRFFGALWPWELAWHHAKVWYASKLAKP